MSTEENLTSDEESTNIEVEKEDTDSKGESKKFKWLEIKLPKWALIILMIIPAAIFITIILLVDIYVGFPTNINPIAVIGITGIGLVMLVVIADMAYRNYFSYRLVRRESAKSKVYKEILRERQERKAASSKQEFLDVEDEYEYEYDDEEEELTKQEPKTNEYDYEEKLDDDDEEKYYRLRSLIFRGGLFSILIVNGLIILVAAFILQLTYGGGFNIPTS